MARTTSPLFSPPQRPLWPFGVNWNSMQIDGLLAWLPAFGDPLGLRDLIQSWTEVPFLASTVATGSPLGIGIGCTANNRGCRATAPTAIQNLVSVSLYCSFWQVAAGNGNASFLKVSYANTDTTPFAQYEIGLDSTAAGLCATFNASGTFKQVKDTAGLPGNGDYHQFIYTQTGGSQVVYFDGVSRITGSNAISAVNSGTSPQLCIGTDTSDITTRNPGAIILDCRIYNRVLTAAEVAQMWTAEGRWELYDAMEWDPLVLGVGNAAPPPAIPAWGSGLLLSGMGNS